MKSLVERVRNFINTRRWPHDELFEKLLDIEFADDLRVVMLLDQIPTYERTDPQANLIDWLKEKYTPEGSCPSTLFPHVSTRLQNEYLALHSAICAFLYGENLNWV